jgi:hypothetical protein
MQRQDTVLKLHDTGGEGLRISTTRQEHDESMFGVMAAKQIEMLAAGYRIGQYVAGLKEQLKGELAAEQRQWLAAHLKEHEDWYADSLNVLTEERDRRFARERELAAVRTGNV